MSLAAAYFSRLASEAALDSDDEREGLHLRGWARATVLSARYAVADESRLNAVRRAANAWDEMEPKEVALVLENLLDLYDVFGDQTALREAVSLRFGGKATAVALLRAEAWIKLAATASAEGCAAFLQKGETELASLSREPDHLSDAEFTALESWLEIAAVYRDRLAHALPLRNLRGLRFPWGFRTPGFRTPAALQDVGHAILRRLDASVRANGYLVRDVRADIASNLARSLPPAEAIPYLQQAVEIRSGPAAAHLPLFQSYFRNAEDLYLHAQLDATRESSLRRRALVELLIAPKTSAAERAASLVLIASDVAKHGASAVTGVGADPDILIAVSNGDQGALMERAASILASESQLDDTKLGGRGEVRAVRGSEYDDGYTFVLKSTNQKQVNHDLWVQQVLRPELRAAGRAEFLLTDHLCTISRDSVQSLETDAVDEVRWYEPGLILSDYARLHPGEQGEEKMRGAAEYLGLFHRLMWAHPAPRGSGQELRRKDLGMWLRTMLGDEAGAAFRSWRNACAFAPDVRRRDAHPDNWIVTDDGGIVAFDFEASTSRPLFYELAQLVEDGQLLEPDDVGARERLIQSYISGLDASPVLADLDKQQVRHLYAIGAMARCVRSLSSADATIEMSQRAMQTFLSMKLWIVPACAPTAFVDAIEAWWNDHGGQVAGENATMSSGRRTRLSKAMSYNLRHNTSTMVGRDGWVDIEHLVEGMRANGHSVDADLVRSVAKSPEEHRFEVSGTDIRARYGHSKALALKTTRHEARPPSALFHGTPSASLRSILDARAGLSRGSREFVHLSVNVAGARRPAERFGGPVVVLKVSPDAPGLLPESGGVWLAPRVAAQYLSVMPLFEELELV